MQTSSAHWNRLLRHGLHTNKSNNAIITLRLCYDDCHVRTCPFLGPGALKFIGTVSAVGAPIADQPGVDAVAIGTSEQIQETRRVTSDAIGLVRTVGAVGFSVANVRSFYTADSSRSYALELAGSARS